MTRKLGDSIIINHHSHLISQSCIYILYSFTYKFLVSRLTAQKTMSKITGLFQNLEFRKRIVDPFFLVFGKVI